MAALPCTSTRPGGTILYARDTISLPIFRHVILPIRKLSRSHVVSAKKLSSRTGRFDGRNKRSGVSTKEQDDDEQDEGMKSTAETGGGGYVTAPNGDIILEDGTVIPKLPGLEKDFWEGPQWDALGFFVEYMWAFGIGFALIACGFAVTSYNEGATDFKATPAFKESIQSRDLLEEPEGSTADVFESNPTEDAPSLE